VFDSVDALALCCRPWPGMIRTWRSTSRAAQPGGAGFTLATEVADWLARQRRALQRGTRDHRCAGAVLRGRGIELRSAHGAEDLAAIDERLTADVLPHISLDRAVARAPPWRHRARARARAAGAPAGQGGSQRRADGGSDTDASGLIARSFRRHPRNLPMTSLASSPMAWPRGCPACNAATSAGGWQRAIAACWRSSCAPSRWARSNWSYVAQVPDRRSIMTGLGFTLVMMASGDAAGHRLRRALRGDAAVAQPGAARRGRGYIWMFRGTPLLLQLLLWFNLALVFPTSAFPACRSGARSI
jgi:hypothetical protein